MDINVLSDNEVIDLCKKITEVDKDAINEAFNMDMLSFKNLLKRSSAINLVLNGSKGLHGDVFEVITHIGIANRCQKPFILNKDGSLEQLIHTYQLKKTNGTPFDISIYDEKQDTIYIGTCKYVKINREDETIPLTKSEVSDVVDAYRAIKNKNPKFEKTKCILTLALSRPLVKKSLEELFERYITTGDVDEILILYPCEHETEFHNRDELCYASKHKITIESLNYDKIDVQSSLTDCNGDIQKLLDKKFKGLGKKKLTPYQKDCVNKLTKRIFEVKDELKNNPSISESESFRLRTMNIFCSPRFGKSVVSSHIIKNIYPNGSRICIICSFTGTFKQYEDIIYDVFNYKDINVITNNGKKGKYDPNKVNIYIISNQYLVYKKKIKKNIINLFPTLDALVCDEAHYGNETVSIKNVFKLLNDKCIIIRMTGTPFTTGLSNYLIENTFIFWNTDGYEWANRGLDCKRYDHKPLLYIETFDGKILDGRYENGYIFDNYAELLSENNINNVRMFEHAYFNYIRKGFDKKEVIDRHHKYFPNTWNDQDDNKTQIYNWLFVFNTVSEMNVFLLVMDEIKEKYNITYDYSTSDEYNSEEALNKANNLFDKKFDGSLRIMCVVGQLSTGVTMENCQGIGMLNDTTSLISIDQTIGRAGNPHKDHNGNWMPIEVVILGKSQQRVEMMAQMKQMANHSSDVSRMNREIEYRANCFYSFDGFESKHIDTTTINEEVEKYFSSSEYVNSVINNDYSWFGNLKDDFDVSDFEGLADEYKAKKSINILIGDETREPVNNLKKIVSYTENPDYVENGDNMSEEETEESKKDRENKIRLALANKFRCGQGHALVTLQKNDDINSLEELISGDFEEKMGKFMDSEFEGKSRFKYYFSDDYFSSFANYKELSDFMNNIIPMEKWHDNYLIVAKCIIDKIKNNETFDISPLIFDRTNSKERGEVFTPISLVNEMLDLLPKTVWSNPTLKFLDNSMGSGIFLLEIKRRLMNGLASIMPNDDERKKHIESNMIYGVEIDEKNYMLSCDSVFGGKNEFKHFYCADSLNFDYWGGLKFDVIVGNPPYNQPRNKKNDGSDIIWDKFVHKALELLEDNGHMVYIHPIGWRQYLSSTNLWDAMIKKNIKYIRNISESKCMSIFINVAQRLDYYYLENKDYEHKTKVIDNYNNEFECDLSNYSFLTSESFDLVTKYLAKEGEEKAVVIKPKNIKDADGTIPLINAVTVDESNIRFDKTSKDNGYGVSKVIFAENGRKGRFKDKEGKYSVGQYCFAIECNKEDADAFYEYSKSEEMNNIIEALRWSVLHCKYNVLSLFKKDWWKSK